MKKLSIAGALLLSAGLAHAQNPPSNPPYPREPARQPPSTGSGSGSTDPARDTGKAQTHKMTAEIVSTDATAKTITVKNLAMSRDQGDYGSRSIGDAGQVTLRLDAKASDRVSSLKAGDKVTLTCKADGMGGNPPSSSSPSDTGGTSGSSGSSSHCQTVTEVKKSS